MSGTPPVFAVRNATRDIGLANQVGVADSPLTKLVGLLGRPGLAVGEGLWFPDTNSIHMMGMRFPIDVIFLGPEVDGISAVTDLRENLAPWTGVVWWSRGAKAALELPAGVIAASGTRPGDVITRERVI